MNTAEPLNATAPKPTPKLILASRVLNTPVQTPDGSAAGYVTDLSIDRVSGQCIYAIMSFGGFLGIGERFHPLPWDKLHYDVERGAFVVPVDREELRNAPHYTGEELANLGGASHHPHDDAVDGYYRLYRPFPYI
jgi:hypothetical protein